MNYNQVKQLISTAMGPLPSGSHCYAQVMNWITRLASSQTNVLQHGRLTGYMLILFCLMALLILFGALHCRCPLPLTGMVLIFMKFFWPQVLWQRSRP